MLCRLAAVGIRRAAALAFAVLLVTALAAGCSNRESAAARAPVDTGTATAKIGSDGVQQVLITGDDQFRFVPSTVDAKPGRLRIILTNSGATPHDLAVEGAGPSGQTGLVGAGEKVQITVTLAPGRHKFVCTLHTRLHMMGTIIVS